MSRGHGPRHRVERAPQASDAKEAPAWQAPQRRWTPPPGLYEHYGLKPPAAAARGQGQLRPPSWLLEYHGVRPRAENQDAANEGAARQEEAAPTSEAAEAASENAAAEDAGAANEDQVTAGGTVPMVGAAAVAPKGPALPLPGPWRPPGKQPIPLYIGNMAHEGIGFFYKAVHQGESVHLNHFSIASILDPNELAELGLTLHPPGLAPAAEELAGCPDITNLTRLHIYEIKPKGAEAEGQAQARAYQAMFALAGLPVALGSTTELGTAGEIPAPGGFYVFFSPIEGVIVYVKGNFDKVKAPVPQETWEQIRQKLAELKQRLADLGAGAGEAIAQALPYLVAAAALTGLGVLLVVGSLPASLAGAAAALVLVVSGEAVALARSRPEEMAPAPEGAKRATPRERARPAGLPGQDTVPEEETHAEGKPQVHSISLEALVAALGEPQGLGSDPARLDRALALAEAVLGETAALAETAPEVALLQAEAAALQLRLAAARPSRSSTIRTAAVPDARAAAVARGPKAAAGGAARRNEAVAASGDIQEYVPTAEAPAGPARSFDLLIVAGPDLTTASPMPDAAPARFRLLVEPEGEAPFVVTIALRVKARTERSVELEVVESWYVAERGLGSACGTVYTFPRERPGEAPPRSKER